MEHARVGRELCGLSLGLFLVCGLLLGLFLVCGLLFGLFWWCLCFSGLFLTLDFFFEYIFELFKLTVLGPIPAS